MGSTSLRPEQVGELDWFCFEAEWLHDAFVPILWSNHDMVDARRQVNRAVDGCGIALRLEPEAEHLDS